jgi:multiple sugar transport system permease protein
MTSKTLPQTSAPSNSPAPGTSPAPLPARRRPRLLERLDRYDRWLLPGPAVITVLAMLAVPVVYTLFLSVHKWSGGLVPPLFVGADNYTEALSNDRFWGGIGRTAYFVGVSVALQVVLGVAAALVFHRSFVGRGVARTFFMFPMIATPTAIALVWSMMFDPTIGVLGYLVESVGGPQLLWTTDPDLVIIALAVVDTWQWTPLIMIIVLAGLAALPTEPFEAARVDGAGELRTLFSITLPLLRPVILVAALFRMIDCIKTFDIIKVITDGGPAHASETLNLYAFEEALTYLDFGYGSALLVLLTVLVFGVAIVHNWIRKRSEAL